MLLRREAFLNELLADLTSLHERDGDAGREARRRAAEQGCGHSVQGLADRRHSPVAWLRGVDCQSPRLPPHPWPFSSAVLTGEKSEEADVGREDDRRQLLSSGARETRGVRGRVG